ncbi:uncharacterized protein LOC143293572 [Babylonia areolata]|uniref:uncharacterized protein LOC143293572 n=1 Tax=Babylonia areolata TaxID=304850 RepID=UPI003FD29A0F
MDQDSSAKFIGSLTKFLQSLCNGYVEFQKGVELVGHIYLNIDTGEKVDYILHEKVSKNDENSVSFVSNSFHAQPTDKTDTTGKKGVDSKGPVKGSEQASDDNDDDDIMIVDQSERMPGSTNTGTMPHRGLKGPTGNRLAQHAAFQSHNQGSGSPLSSQSRFRQHYGGPSATVTNQNMHQDNINIEYVKLEQISADELLSITSQVDEGGTSSHVSSEAGQRSHIRQGSQSLNSSAGQPVWIKQEAPDDSQSQSQGGQDTGWPRSRDGQSDSSNSGSDLYPVMMHQNPAFPSNPVIPGFSSGQSSASSHHSQPHLGMSSGANPYANPMSGTSQGMSGIDSAAVRVWKKRLWSKVYWQQVKRDPSRHERHKQKARESMRKFRAQQRAQGHGDPRAQPSAGGQPGAGQGFYPQ